MTRNLVYASIVGISMMTTFSLTPLSAQVTPDHIAKMKTVISSSTSDQGEYIAYTIATPADPKKENAYSQVHLYVYDVQAQESKSYFTSASVSQVTFRPQTGTITFLTKTGDDKTNGLYEMNINGGEAKKIFAHSANIANYSWSKDGQQLAFVSVEKGNKPSTSLTYSPTFFEEEYSNRKAYIVNISNNGKAQQLHLNGEAYLIEWSHDGQKLAVSTAPTASVDDSYMKQQIKIVSTSTRNELATIDNKGKLSQVSWSPDGSALAILGAYDINDPTAGSISIVTSDSRKPKVIDGQYKGKFESIDWKENGKIYYHASEGTSSVIGTITPDGKERKFIVYLGFRNVTSFSLADNGFISFTANDALHPTELFTIAATGNRKPKRVTNTNPWLDAVKIAEQEVITYKTRDGKYDIQGMLIYPLNYKEGNKYPLITVVHGGPESHYSNGWLTAYSMPGQMAAAEGYAVFYPNYRGSTGRGIDFTYSSQSDPAGKEFDDIVDGVDHLIAMGIADKNRIGVTGGSYGGYASAWMSTYYSDRFAAAVMFVGISNNISKFGTSDIPNEMYLVHERGYVWEDWKKQLEVSPIYYVDRAQTPILIMHGAEDPRVHPAQSMELYRHIKVRKPDVPVRLIYYPGEGHGNARSGSRYDYNQRMMQWFDVYLKSGNPKAAMPSLDLPE